MNKRICPVHLRGKPVGHSYHDADNGGRIEITGHSDGSIPGETLDNLYNAPASEQVRPYDETKGVAALLRETFGFEGLEKIAQEPNSILEALPFKTVNSPTYRYERADGSGGTVTGRTSHLHPNPSAEPKRARLPVHIIYEPEDAMQSQPPKSSQPPRDVQALVKAISAGRDKVDAELIAEIACFGGANLEWLIEQPFDHLMKLRTVRQQQRAEADAALKKLAQQAKAAFLQPLMDTCSAAPPGQPMPKIKISVYLDDGNVFEYEVDTVTSAREHVSLIVKTGYRHSDRARPDELVHFPPHRILKVKMRGHGISTNYYDAPRGT